MLREIQGVHPRVAKAFHTLIKEGRTITSEKIAEEAGIPRDKARNIIGLLRTRKIVRSGDRTCEGLEYVLVDPEGLDREAERYRTLYEKKYGASMSPRVRSTENRP